MNFGNFGNNPSGQQYPPQNQQYPQQQNQYPPQNQGQFGQQAPQQQPGGGFGGQIGFVFPGNNTQQPPNQPYQQPHGYPSAPQQQPGQFGLSQPITNQFLNNNPSGGFAGQPQQPQQYYQPNQYPNANQMGGNGVPQAPNYQPQYPNPQSSSFSNNQPRQQNWNINDYLQSVFNSFDTDRNGSITQSELQIAFARTQQAFSFDTKTIDFILIKFDSNRDSRITFNEFFNLYSYLNEEYAQFVMADTNSSGTIEVPEFTNLLNNRGVRVHPQCIQSILQSVEQMLQKRITFDIFCRVNARFDYLCKCYRMMQNQMNGQPIEQYLSNNFFTEFW